MQNKFFSIHLDFIGFSASMLCAIHCISLPILLSMSTLSGLAWLENELLEFGIILLSLFIATWSLGQGYRKQHSKFDAFVIMLAGFSTIVLSRFLGEALEPVLMMLGGTLIAWSHFYNWKLIQKYKKNTQSLLA
ncbi:MAG: MerC domain-containing protein [Bacteroidota bacterium]